MIDGALAREGWDRLGYQPREESVLPVLLQLRRLIEGLPGEVLEPVGSWLPEELPTDGDCALHRVPLARLGCMLCNDVGLTRG